MRWQLDFHEQLQQGVFFEHSHVSGISTTIALSTVPPLFCLSRSVGGEDDQEDDFTRSFAAPLFALRSFFVRVHSAAEREGGLFQIE